MLTLGIDTSSTATTAALARVSAGSAPGGRTAVDVVAERVTVAANRHGELLAPMICELLAVTGAAPTDLSRIVVGVGPGPFTGLRIGLVTAVALGQALGIEVVGVCSLDAVAHAVDRPWPEGYAVLTDARRREVYWAAYRDGERVSDPGVDRPGEIRELPRVVAGAGAILHRDQLPDVRLDDRAPYPSAAALLRLSAERHRLLPVRPLYLRRPDARPPGRPKAVTPA